MTKDRNIGVAMNFSTESKQALRWVIDKLINEGDTLYLIHVKPPRGDVASDTDLPSIPWEKFHQREVMQKYEVELEPEVISIVNPAVWQNHVGRVEVKIYWGDAGDKLREAAEALNLDSLVMGSRGPGTIQGVLPGSVTNYVLANASCPVTVVKKP